MEFWRDIPNYYGYQASSLGRIRSLDQYKNHSRGGKFLKKGRILKQFPNKNWPYLYVRFNPYNKTFRSHRLIAMVFIPNPKNLPEVNHLNGDKQDNRVENLQWVSSSENTLHSYKTGLHKPSFGNSKLTKDDVFEIRCLHYYGAKLNRIAKEYCVDPSTIGLIINRKTWTHV